ncbi:MAG: outer membrane lipoprotein carrier protein LolA [Bacteroidales bacterium]|jgi:outer membrane lipoprotein-sorting protein|nr:outer membrane lipoprotein carrier protein LolA [Bacteroidales bacterium]MCK4637793.1 outer membrane lipoprotein carrier protein LolA [Bacteroidales bacterium]
MNGYKNFITLSVLTFYCFSSFSQSSYKAIEDISLFKSNLAEMSRKTNTIKSDFIQEKNLSFLSEKIISKGLFYFKKENKIRWQYTEPFDYLIIINDDKIFIKDEDKESKYDMGSNNIFNEINKIITGCVQGKILNNDKDYKIEYYENDNFYYVKLTPYSEKMKEFLSNIDIYFDKKDLSVSKLEMIELLGDYTKIEFLNKKLNEEIPDKEFNDL